MNNPCWKGLLASFLLPGAGQFFQGRLKFASSAFLVAYGSIPLFLLLLSVPLVPPILVLYFLPILWMVSLYLFVDSWRPTPQIGWKRWLMIIIISIALYNGEKAGFLSACRIYKIPANSSSMSPTIQKGDLVFCLRAAYWFCSPQRGDIVVFPHQTSFGHNSILEKRLVGLPGDSLSLNNNGALLVNDVPYTFTGQPIDYSSEMTAELNSFPVNVPTGMMFVLGDNPSQSYDSRYFGAIPLDSIIGKITVILWPISRVQRITPTPK